MADPTYIADLSREDYPRFRQKDPTLPATFEEWAVATHERTRRLRRNGLNLVRYPIHFDDLVLHNEILNIASFDQAARDYYADEQARAEEVARRF